MYNSVIEIDLHGLNTYQAKVLIDSRLKYSKGVYRIRIIHGYNNGTALRSLIRKEYNGKKGVLRVEAGLNRGITELVLKEL